MQLIIAEKPSLARNIAAALGVSARRDGYMEGNGYLVTWAFGQEAIGAAADFLPAGRVKCTGGQ